MGLTEAKKAKKLLNKYAPKGEKLAYINNKEAKLLKKLGGAGIDINGTGIKSYIEYDDSYGSGHASASSSSSRSDNGGGDNRENYISQQYVAPAPAPTPEPEYDTADFAFTTPTESYSEPDTSEDDFVNPLDEFGIKGDVYADTVYDDDDKGDSLYITKKPTVSPTQTMKDEEPYMDYRPGPNYVTAQQLSNLNRGIGDSDERAATLANIQAINPIQQPTGILETAGTRLKNFAIDFGLNALTGGLYGRLKTPYKIAQAVDNRFFDDQIPGITKFAKYNKNPGTGFKDNTFQSDSDDRPIPKDVITASVQKYSPKLNAEQLNRAITIRDQLQSYAETGRLNEKGQLTLQQLNNLIEQYQVSV
jgi:hypothetical protein